MRLYLHSLWVGMSSRSYESLVLFCIICNLKFQLHGCFGIENASWKTGGTSAKGQMRLQCISIIHSAPACDFNSTARHFFLPTMQAVAWTNEARASFLIFVRHRTKAPNLFQLEITAFTKAPTASYVSRYRPGLRISRRTFYKLAIFTQPLAYDLAVIWLTLLACFLCAFPICLVTLTCS